MFDNLSYELKIRRLQRQKNKIRMFYKNKSKEYRKNDENIEKIDNIIGETMMELDLITDEISQLQSAYILQQAELYLIPKPAFRTKDGAWEQSDITGQWRLAEHPISELRDVVRREKKERREHWQSWLVLVVGFVGALTGLFSVLNSN